MPSPRRTRGDPLLRRSAPRSDLELAVVIEQEDAEGAVIDHLLGELRDAREELIEVQNRRDLTPDFGERLERLRVEPALLEEARIDDGDRDVRGDLPQHGHVVVAEVIRVAAEQVERANRLRLVEQRHDDFRRHPGDELDVSRIRREIVDAERLPVRDGGADQSLPELQAKRRHAVRYPTEYATFNSPRRSSRR